MASVSKRNTVIQISSRSHLNITFNLLSCGNCDINTGEKISIAKNEVFTLCYVNEGQGSAAMSSSSSRIGEGSAFAVFPDDECVITNLGREVMNVTWVSFTGYLIENYLHRAGVTNLRPVFNDVEGVVAKYMEHLYATSLKMPNRYCKMAADLYNIFGYLLDQKTNQGFVDENINPEFYALSAIDHIERNIARGITVEELGEKLNLSRKELDKVFSTVLNISPKKYIILVRINKALTALRKTNKSISEIAESVGYANQFYFAKEFKRLTGKTPTEYRTSSDDVEMPEFASMLPMLNNKFDYKVIGEIERKNI